MVAAVDPLSIKLILDAGVIFMGLLSGGVKEIAPPEMPKYWVILGTIVSSGAYFSAKVLLDPGGIQVSRETWLFSSLFFIWLAVGCGFVYLLTRQSRTIRYNGETKLASRDDEYREAVKEEPTNKGKTRDDLLADAAGETTHVWTAAALNRSRRILGFEYTLFVALLAFGLFLGIEAYNKADRAPTFAEKTEKLRPVHFEFDQSELGQDAINVLIADAAILEGLFKEFPKATVILEGRCDERGTDEYNFALGYKRAEAARQVLIAEQIDEKRITMSSRGRKNPMCQEESCRRQNRSVLLIAIQN
jgi:outer membrane protein OmpA-like peptidoglycan-associated protein